ncbi:MAG TPA: SCO family protein, partial [Myxococcota bacterium]
MTTTILATTAVIARRAARALGTIACAVTMTAVASTSSACFVFDDVPHGGRDETITPPQLVGTEIVPKLGNPVPMATKLLDEDGKPVALKDVLATDKPTLLILGYWECPTLCSFVLNATKDALAGVEGLEPGVDYNIIAVGIDPGESAGLAKTKQANYLAALAKVQGKASLPPSSWRFLTAPQDEGFLADKHESTAVRTLAEAVGFGYRWDVQTETYAHGAGIFFIGPDGTLSRTLWGIQFKSRDVRL